MNQKGLSTIKTFLWKVIRIFGIVVLTIGMFPNSAMAADYDLTFIGSAAVVNGVEFLQFDPSESAGTGSFDPFLSVQGDPTERAYNTDGTCEFETAKCPSGYTHALLLSDVPMVYKNLTWYREFQIDINENDLYVDLTELKLYTDSSPTLTDYDGTGFDTATLVYDLDAGGDNTLNLAYLQSGSGEADYLVLVPDSIFGADPNCDFGGTGCTTYVYWYTKLGQDPILNPPRNSDDGFEEIAVSVGTARLDPPVFEVTKWVYDYATDQYYETVGWVFDAKVAVSDTTPTPDDYYWLNPTAGTTGPPDNIGNHQSQATPATGAAVWSWIPGGQSLPMWSWNSEVSFYEVPQGGLVFEAGWCTRTYSDGITPPFGPFELKNSDGSPYSGNLTSGSPAYVFYEAAGDNGNDDRLSKVHCDIFNNKTTAVTLNHFTATLQNNQTVLVEWQTNKQTQTIGFNLYRSKFANGKNQVKLNSNLIPIDLQKNYEFTDSNVKTGKTYYYWLEALYTDDSSEFFGTDPVTVPKKLNPRGKR